MANPFDQFDTTPATPPPAVATGAAPPAAPMAPSGNSFDQFDPSLQPAISTSDTKPPDTSAQTGTAPASQMQGGFRLPAIFGSATVKSIADTLGLPGDAEAAIHRGLAWVTNQIGLPPPPSWTTTNILPTSAAMESLVPSGVINRPDLQAQNETERLVQAGGQGTGAAIPFLAGGPIASLVKEGEAVLPSAWSALRELFAGAGGGVGSYEGSKVGPPGSLASTAGQFAGGFLGGTAADVAAGTAGKIAATAAGSGGPALDPYTRLGIMPRMVGDVTQDPALQTIQEYTAKLPGASGVTQEAAGQTQKEFQTAVENTANTFGDHQTAQEAGQALQNGVRTWINQWLPALRSIYWLPVNQAIPSDTPTPLTNYRATLESLTNPTPGMAATGQVLAPKTAGNLLTALNQDLPAGQPATWGTAQDVLHHVGDMMGTPSFVDDIGKNNLAALYAALKQDMSGTANRMGVGPQYKYANDASTVLYGTRDQLSTYAKAKNPALETVDPNKATSSALANNTDLQTIRANIPDAADALASYELRQLGKRGGTAGPAGETVSPASFLTNLNKMRYGRPEGTQALYGDNQGVSDLSQVAQDMKGTTKFANPSGTASHEALTRILESLTGLGGAAGTMAATGEQGLLPILGGLGAAATLPMLGYGMARAITSPTVARFIGTPSMAPRIMPPSVVPAAILGRP